MDHKLNRLIKVLILLCITSEVYGKSADSKKPLYFPTCYRDDPQINQCLLNATEQIRPYLAKGVPELDIPSFEPFVIPQITLEQGTKAIHVKAVLNSVVVRGLTKYKFTRFDFVVPNYQFLCEATIPGLRLDGDYVASGRILVAPLEGKGKFNAEIDSANVLIDQKYKVATLDDGKDHLVPVTTNITVDVVKPRVHLDGLFNGNDQLSAVTNKAISDNVDALFEELKPVIEKAICALFEDVLIKSIMKHIPWNELFPVNSGFH